MITVTTDSDRSSPTLMRVMTADRIDSDTLADRRAVLALSQLLLAGFDPDDALAVVHFTIDSDQADADA